MNSDDVIKEEASGLLESMLIKMSVGRERILIKNDRKKDLLVKLTVVDQRQFAKVWIKWTEDCEETS